MPLGLVVLNKNRLSPCSGANFDLGLEIYLHYIDVNRCSLAAGPLVDRPGGRNQNLRRTAGCWPWSAPGATPQAEGSIDRQASSGTALRTGTPRRIRETPCVTRADHLSFGRHCAESRRRTMVADRDPLCGLIDRAPFAGNGHRSSQTSRPPVMRRAGPDGVRPNLTGGDAMSCLSVAGLPAKTGDPPRRAGPDPGPGRAATRWHEVG